MSSSSPFDWLIVISRVDWNPFFIPGIELTLCSIASREKQSERKPKNDTSLLTNNGRTWVRVFATIDKRRRSECLRKIWAHITQWKTTIEKKKNENERNRRSSLLMTRAENVKMRSIRLLDTSMHFGQHETRALERVASTAWVIQLRIEKQ